MPDVTELLSKIEIGDSNAADQLLPLIYDELRSLAAARLSEERAGQTLQATALVHEAYVRLVDQREPQSWTSRGHFFGAAAEAMRRILVENARRKNAIKRGGGLKHFTLEDDDLAIGPREDLLALDEALTQLEQHDALAASLVKLRYFAGLTMEQAAESLAIPKRTAERNWTYARTWLHAQLIDHE